MAEEPLRVGIASFAHVHAPAYAHALAEIADAALVGIWDDDPARGADAARIYGTRFYERLDDLLAGVDTLIVAAQNTRHKELVLAAAAARVPVLCEKPLATTAEACLRVIEAEVASGRRLVSLGFMRRFDPLYEELRAVLSAAGAPLLVHCAHRNAAAPPIYTSEMLITSSAVHEIDITRWLLGEEIVAATVRAPRSTTQAPNGLRDPQLVLLETASGVLVDVEVFVNARYGYDIRCEVVGEEGAVRLAEQVAPDFRARFATAYRRELDCWVQGLDDGPSAWDGYAANAVADACLASLATGERAAVEMASRPRLYG